MSKTDGNEQIDADILQCKKDVLRARDIVPPSRREKRRQPEPQEKGGKTAASADTPQRRPEKEKTVAGADGKPQLSENAKEKSLKDAIPSPAGKKRISSKDVSAVSEGNEKTTPEDTSVIPIETLEPAKDKTAKVPTAEEKKAAEKVRNEGESSIQQIISELSARRPTAEERTAETENAPQKENKIPRFDLAEEIMAQQRRISAIKRKAPGKKIEPLMPKPQAEPTGDTIEQPGPLPPEKESIIAEIVARDIERLCRGGVPGVEKQNLGDAKENIHQQS